MVLGNAAFPGAVVARPRDDGAHSRGNGWSRLVVVGLRLSSDPLQDNGERIQFLSEAIRDGKQGLNDIPETLVYVIREACWRERLDPRTGHVVKFDRFEDFVTTPPLDGLGATMGLLRNLVRDNPEALDALDAENQRPHGGDRRSEEFKGNNVPVERPQGNTAAKALRRLRAQKPDLHARVLAGELSPHAAMIEAGFRHRTLTVPCEPTAAARALIRHLSTADLARLIALLMDGIPSGPVGPVPPDDGM